MLNGGRSTRTSAARRWTWSSRTRSRKPRVANAGVSAEFGRFSGGVVNIITKSGGNKFSRLASATTLQQRQVADVDAVREDALADAPRRPRIDKVVPTYEYTLGGPVMRDRLWFFASGRAADAAQRRQLIGHQHSRYQFTDKTAALRGQGHLLARPASTGSRARTPPRSLARSTTRFNTNLTMDLRSLGTRKLPEQSVAVNYSGMLDRHTVRRGAVSKRHVQVHRLGRQVDRPHRRHAAHRQQPRRRAVLVATRSAASARPRGATATDIFAKGSYFLSTPTIRLAQLVFGYDTLQRHPHGQQPPVGQRLPHPRRRRDPHRHRRRRAIFPIFLGDGTHDHPVEPDSDPRARARASGRTRAVRQRHVAAVSDRLTANVGLRFDKNHGTDQSGTSRRQGQRVEPAARHHLGSDRQAGSGA